MKWLLFLLSIYCYLSPLQAQTQQAFPLSIGVISESFNRLGLSVGTDITLTDWQRVKSKKGQSVVKTKKFLLSPQLGFYYHQQNNFGLLAGIDLGIRKQKENKKWFNIWSLGLGSFTQFNAGLTYQEQADGTIATKKRASRTYFNPSINYEFGQDLNTQISWYAKGTLGFKVPYNTFFSILPLVEAGIKINLKNE